jgi:hypothetical protein
MDSKVNKRFDIHDEADRYGFNRRIWFDRHLEGSRHLIWDTGGGASLTPTRDSLGEDVRISTHSAVVPGDDSSIPGVGDQRGTCLGTCRSAHGSAVHGPTRGNGAIRRKALRIDVTANEIGPSQKRSSGTIRYDLHNLAESSS